MKQSSGAYGAFKKTEVEYNAGHRMRVAVRSVPMSAVLYNTQSTKLQQQLNTQINQSYDIWDSTAAPNGLFDKQLPRFSINQKPTLRHFMRASSRSSHMMKNSVPHHNTVSHQSRGVGRKFLTFTSPPWCYTEDAHHFWRNKQFIREKTYLERTKNVHIPLTSHPNFFRAKQVLLPTFPDTQYDFTAEDVSDISPYQQHTLGVPYDTPSSCISPLEIGVSNGSEVIIQSALAQHSHDSNGNWRIQSEGRGGFETGSRLPCGNATGFLNNQPHFKRQKLPPQIVQERKLQERKYHQENRTSARYRGEYQKPDQRLLGQQESVTHIPHGITKLNHKVRSEGTGKSGNIIRQKFTLAPKHLSATTKSSNYNHGTKLNGILDLHGTTPLETKAAAGSFRLSAKNFTSNDLQTSLYEGSLQDVAISLEMSTKQGKQSNKSDPTLGNSIEELTDNLVETIAKSRELEEKAEMELKRVTLSPDCTGTITIE